MCYFIALYILVWAPSALWKYRTFHEEIWMHPAASKWSSHSFLVKLPMAECIYFSFSLLVSHIQNMLLSEDCHYMKTCMNVTCISLNINRIKNVLDILDANKLTLHTSWTLMKQISSSIFHVYILEWWVCFTGTWLKFYFSTVVHIFLLITFACKSVTAALAISASINVNNFEFMLNEWCGCQVLFQK